MPKASNYQTPRKDALLSKRLQFIAIYNVIQENPYVTRKKGKKKCLSLHNIFILHFPLHANNIQKYLFTYLLGEGLWFRFSAHFFCILFILLSSKGFQCRWGPLKSWRKNAHKFDMLLCFWSCKNVLFYTFNISSSRKTFVCTCLILQVFVVSWFPET